MLSYATALGPLLLQPWLQQSSGSGTLLSSLAAVSARFFPWLIGAVLLTAAFSLRWLPRVHRRLLEPSLIAAWIAAACGAVMAFGLNRVGIWSWTWSTVSPDVASSLSLLLSRGHYVAIGLWLVCACLVSPLLIELFFRHALLEQLRQSGMSTLFAVLLTSVAFAAAYLGIWILIPGGGSLHSDAGTLIRLALLLLLFGVILGTVAAVGKRGRGLALAVIAHATFVTCELGTLLRSLAAG